LRVVAVVVAEEGPARVESLQRNSRAGVGVALVGLRAMAHGFSTQEVRRIAVVALHGSGDRTCVAAGDHRSDNLC
jgi:hypothetical protein